jgi:hypothetical protein
VDRFFKDRPTSARVVANMSFMLVRHLIASQSIRYAIKKTDGIPF